MKEDKPPKIIQTYINGSDRTKNITEDAQISLIIDFGQQDFLEDPIEVTSCYQVFASNGQRGRIDHLHQDVNPENFAEDLKRKLGDDPKVRLCITGGLDRNGTSKSFGPKLISSIKNRGFVIGECDIGGNYFRRGRIYSDRVVILRKEIGTNESEEIILNFEKVDIDT